MRQVVFVDIEITRHCVLRIVRLELLILTSLASANNQWEAQLSTYPRVSSEEEEEVLVLLHQTTYDESNTETILLNETGLDRLTLISQIRKPSLRTQLTL
jgi:lipopolysaccharide export system protein LptC